LSRRIAIAVAALALLGACGFEPLYGERGSDAPVGGLLEQVAVSPIADRTGQLLRIELTNRLTPTTPTESRYNLEVTLSESQASLAVRRDATATRANLTISANYSLRRNGNAQILTSGSIRSVNSYDILTSDFATLAAEADARKRATRDIADAIVDRLAIFLSRTAPASR
jgi:LPS-assembly lipoprotein